MSSSSWASWLPVTFQTLIRCSNVHASRHLFQARFSHPSQSFTQSSINLPHEPSNLVFQGKLMQMLDSRQSRRFHRVVAGIRRGLLLLKPVRHSIDDSRSIYWTYAIFGFALNLHAKPISIPTLKVYLVRPVTTRPFIFCQVNLLSLSGRYFLINSLPLELVQGVF
jgi:hypothetical protein